MTKAISDAQALFIRTNGFEGSARGLVARGLVTYRWGCDPSFGYKVLPAGLAALAAYDAKQQATA